jgi:NADPH:quinone reductase-like Zn-dependent oxidoreductase
VTAWQALFDQPQLKAGQTVLIHGAAGNVGAYAVQVARRARVRIIATAATDDVPFVRCGFHGPPVHWCGMSREDCDATSIRT